MEKCTRPEAILCKMPMGQKPAPASPLSALLPQSLGLAASSSTGRGSSSGSLFSVSLRKLCKVGNWRLIRIARISLTPPLNGFNCGAAGVQLARFENGWSIFSPKLAACGATSLFAWGVNRLHTTHSMDLLINAHLKINTGRHLATLYGKITLFWFLLE